MKDSAGCPKCGGNLGTREVVSDVRIGNSTIAVVLWKSYLMKDKFWLFLWAERVQEGFWKRENYICTGFNCCRVDPALIMRVDKNQVALNITPGDHAVNPRGFTFMRTTNYDQAEPLNTYLQSNPVASCAYAACELLKVGYLPLHRILFNAVDIKFHPIVLEAMLAILYKILFPLLCRRWMF